MLRMSRIGILLLAVMFLMSGCVGVHDAARKGDLKSIRRYVRWGGNLDRKERYNFKWSVETPLILAVQNNQYEAVKLLVELGADVNEKGEAWYTPVGCAVNAEDKRILPYLLDNGGEIEPYKSKSSAMNFAARSGNIEAAKLLLSRGADINHVGWNDTTPLHDAASNGQLETVKYLVENGADIHAKGFNGKTPVECSKNKVIADYLKSKLRK